MRKRILGITLAVSFMALTLAYAFGSGWNLLGDKLNEDISLLALGPNVDFYQGTPCAAFYEGKGGSNPYQGYVKCWEGIGWSEPVGGSVNSHPAFDVQPIKLAVSPTVPQMLYVAIQEQGEILVKKYDTATDSWIQVGNKLNKDYAYEPEIIFIGATPYVMWIEGGIQQTYVSYFDGTAWQSLGGSLNDDPARETTPGRIAALNGSPIVTFPQRTPTGNTVTLVKYWTGSEWTSLGMLNNDPLKDSFRPSIAVHGQEILVALGEKAGGQEKVFVKKYAGGINWLSVGETLNEASPYADAGFSDILFHGNVPYVAFTQKNPNISSQRAIFVKYFNCGWHLSPNGAGEILLNVDPGLDGNRPRLAYDGRDLYVSWSEANGTPLTFSYAYVKKHNGQPEKVQGCSEVPALRSEPQPVKKWSALGK